MKTKSKIDLSKLTADLTACRALAVMSIQGMQDGGTCNFDAPTLYNLRLTPEVKAAIEAAGLRASWYKNHGIVLQIGVGGQGQTRTTAAETFHKALDVRGYATSMYYQMD